jgi:phosphoribosylaminoimidazole (AIR) synthetase
MGIGYVVIVAQDDVALTIRLLEASGTSPRRIGVVQKGSGVTFSD